MDFLEKKVEDKSIGFPTVPYFPWRTFWAAEYVFDNLGCFHKIIHMKVSNKLDYTNWSLGIFFKTWWNLHDFLERTVVNSGKRELDKIVISENREVDNGTDESSVMMQNTQ